MSRSLDGITRSPSIERNLLKGLITSSLRSESDNQKDIFPDVDAVVRQEDFQHDINYAIYSEIKQLKLDDKPIDKILLSHRVRNLAMSFPSLNEDDMEIEEYVEALFLDQVEPKAAVEFALRMVRMRANRGILNKCKEIAGYVRESSTEKFGKFISHVDSLWNEQIMSYTESVDDHPRDVFEDAEQIIEELGNEPFEEAGLTTPFTEFNNLQGGLENGQIYAFVARPGQGKTTFLNHLGYYTAKLNNVPVLCLDTEMTRLEIQKRMVAQLSGVPLWHIKTGNWRKDPDMVKKVRATWAQIKEHRFDHLYIGNMDTDEMISAARRWHYYNVGRGNPCVMILDYIKLTGTESLGKNWAEYQSVGEKINKIKRLCIELNVPFLTAMQLNRSGDSFNRSSQSVVDDSTVIAVSDRLQWFASNVYIFRQKTHDELAEDGPMHGTHLLKPIKTRNQGKESYGHSPYLMKPIPNTGTARPVSYYINFSVENFRVQEMGSLRHVVERLTEIYPLDEENNPNDGNARLL